MKAECRDFSKDYKSLKLLWFNLLYPFCKASSQWPERREPLRVLGFRLWTFCHSEGKAERKTEAPALK